MPVPASMLAILVMSQQLGGHTQLFQFINRRLHIGRIFFSTKLKKDWGRVFINMEVGIR